MSQRFTWIGTYNKLLIGISFSSLALHQVLIIIEGYDWVQALSFAALGVVFFFLGWGGMFLVLGLQTVNPFISKGLLKYYCYFFTAVRSLNKNK